MSNTYTHAAIVPLIGGQLIGQQQAFGSLPEYILSYSVFKNNDSQILNYYDNKVPYHLLDEKPTYKAKNVDVVMATCPCAGLSTLGMKSSSDNPMNDWMIQSADYVLKTVKPKVFWGENAPALAGKNGKPIVAKLRAIAEREGYTMSLYKTKSLLHGLSQVRKRSFYFFWKGKEIPLLPYVNRPYEKIEDTIRKSVVSDDDPMNILANSKTPSEDPVYRYILEELHGGISHKQFIEQLPSHTNTLSYVEAFFAQPPEVTYQNLKEWMSKNNYLNEEGKCERRAAKLASGGNIMRNTTGFAKDYIGAFVGHHPTCLTHPDHDRYLTIRECLDIMKMPKDFELLGGRKNLNHICQNVPVSTAKDMALGIRTALDGKLETVTANFLVQNNHNQTRDMELEVSTLEAFI